MQYNIAFYSTRELHHHKKLLQINWKTFCSHSVHPNFNRENFYSFSSLSEAKGLDLLEVTESGVERFSNAFRKSLIKLVHVGGTD